MSAVRAVLLAVALACVAAACGGDDLTQHSVDLYSRAQVPAVPDRTAAVGGELADGTYWATATGAGDDTVDFTLTQAFFGPACTDELGADACDGDVGVKDEPALTVTVPVGDVRTVTVVDGKQQNYGVDAAELARLVNGDAPSSEAPDGFAFEPFPFVVTVVDGKVVEIRQVWMP